LSWLHENGQVNWRFFGSLRHSRSLWGNFGLVKCLSQQGIKTFHAVSYLFLNNLLNFNSLQLCELNKVKRVDILYDFSIYLHIKTQ
jgi:hypothetical protein